MESWLPGPPPPPSGVRTSAASPDQVLGPRGSRQGTPALQCGPGCLGGRRDILGLRLQATGQVLPWGDEWGDPDRKGTARQN